jgi:hypothetical protein
MFRFLLGIFVGILIFSLFVFFGGGRGMKKVGEGLIDTGKKMESLEERMGKEKDNALKGVKKRILKESAQ